jgi:hypothetical protein
MSFRRTNAGMSNLYLFHGVDAVVFVEGGGEAFTLEQLSQGLYNNQAYDIKYWQIVFGSCAPTKKFHFRAVGSKNSINEIVNLIVANNVKHVFVARDRDFDHLTGILRPSPGIFYTSGYSWENDVWTAPIIFETFRKFSSVPDNEIAAKQLIDSEFANLAAGLRGCVRADAVLSFNKAEPLLRSKFAKIVRPTHNGPPTLVKANARSLVREQRLKIRPHKLKGPSVKVHPLRDCYGHLLETFGYHLLAHALAKLSKLKTLPKELLIPAAIDSFAAHLKTNIALLAHYNPMFAFL